MCVNKIHDIYPVCSIFFVYKTCIIILVIFDTMMSIPHYPAHSASQGCMYELTPGMVGLAPKWVRLAPNGTNPGLFQIRFQCIWRGAPKALKSDLKKPGFVPFGANLTHFGAKPTIPGPYVLRKSRLTDSNNTCISYSF